jgi:hypothetical protein
MRFTKLALLLLLGTLFGSRMAYCQPPPRGDAGQAGTQYFHQRLSPYGQWGTHASYGDVWRPRVAADWRPYSTGHWVYTDYGWTWEADEPWGWAPFHYGRWYHDASQGWGWVPGNVWAPAWVDWRNGGGYIGWAALPPEVGFAAGVGISLGGFDLNAGLVPSSYCFVPERSILEPRLGGFFLSPARNVEIFRGSSNINGIAMVNNRVFNQGMSVQRVEQLRGSAVPRVRVANQAAFYRPAAVTGAARQSGSETFVNRPAPRAASAAAATRPVEGSRSANRQAPSTRSARAGAAPAATRSQARSANLPARGQNGRNAVSRSRTQRPSVKHATPPPAQRRTDGSPATRSHAAAQNPPRHRTPQASARSKPAPRSAAAVNPARHVTPQSSAGPTAASRRAASATPPQHATQQAAARPNPPPRHVAAAAQRPAHAPPPQAKPRQSSPEGGQGQPQG